MNIKYNEIIIGDISKIFDDEKVIELKEKALNERNFINNKIKNNFIKYFNICKGAHERVYTYSTYSDLTEKERAFIYANIVFPNNNKFIEMLLNTLSYDHLVAYIDSLNNLKILNKVKQESEAKQKLIKYCNKITNILLKKVEIYFGYTSIEPVITKINEILTYNKELLITNNNPKTR